MKKHFYRLVKPVWASPKKANGDPNPKFKEEIPGAAIIEGFDFPKEYLKEKNELGYGIYFFPNHPSKNVYETGTKYLNGRVIDTFNYAFVDVDFKDKVYSTPKDVADKIKALSLSPTLFVESGHGVHLYFDIINLTREAYVAIQLKLIKLFDSDRSVFTVLQLLRMPGYVNTKKFGHPVPCEINREFSSFRPDFVVGIMTHLPELSQEEKTRGRTHLDRLDGKLELKFNREVDLDALPDRFLALMLERPKLAKLYEDPTSDGGDRSAADMKLCHFLYSEGFDLQEALAVMSNTQKATEKGASRFDYASLTVSKVFERRKVNNFETVSSYIRNSSGQVLDAEVNGVRWLDQGVLGNPWRKKEILTIIAGSGIGKTAFVLNMIVESLLQNKDSDEVFVFVSIEMSKGQIIKRWIDRVGAESPLADRLYVVDSIGPDGQARLLGLQEIYHICQEIKQHTGVGLCMVAIDHLHLISTHINTEVTPDFGVGAEGDTGYGKIRNTTLNQTCSQLNPLAAMLDTFLIILCQTTKSRGGKGDLPLYKDAAFGVSCLDWVAHRVICLWSPLIRVQSQTDLRVLAFQYAKIREIHVDDKIKINDPKLLTYDLKTGSLEGTNPEEYQEFLRLLPIANDLRAKEAKGEGTSYSVMGT